MKNDQKKDPNGLFGHIVDSLQKNEPRLSDPDEIPEKVMNSIRNLPLGKSQTVFPQASRIRYLIYAQRLLTAASVCLLILFGAEEFMVLKKMNVLEQHTASIRIEPVNTLPRRMLKRGIDVATLRRQFPGRLKLLEAHEYFSQNQHVEPLKTLVP